MNSNKELDQYLIILPDADCEFFKKIQSFLNKGNSIQIFQKKLTDLIIRQPYPTLQILQIINTQSKFYIEKSIVDAFQQIFNENDKYRTEAIIFLANFPKFLYNIENVRKKLLQVLAYKIASNDDEYLLALISNDDINFIKDILDNLKEFWNNSQITPTTIRKELILYQALYKQQHFLTIFIKNIKNFLQIDDRNLRFNFMILKVINELNNEQLLVSECGNIRKWLEDCCLESEEFYLNEIQEFFCKDFQRICTLIEFLKQFPDIYNNIKVGSLISCDSVLRLIYENGIDIGFDDIKHLIDTVYDLQPQLPKLKTLHSLELEALIYYSALALVYDVILADINVNIESYYASKMQQLNIMLRQMRNIDKLCSLIEDLFQMVFIRWEHLQSFDVLQILENASQSNLLTIDTTIASNYRRNGFICRRKTLQYFLTFLKNFVTKKRHTEDYKMSSERVYKRFQQINDAINEGLWKLQILEKIDNSLLKKNIQIKLELEAEHLLQLVRMHCDGVEKSSSDDENRDRIKFASLTRRKAAKKKRRATFCGILTNSTGQTLTLEQFCTERVSGSGSVMNESLSKQLNVCNSNDDYSIIPRMLCSPEYLVQMALALKNFDVAKSIIETFSLQNTDLKGELTFVEQQLEVQCKLARIYANYQRQEHFNIRNENGEQRTTVEQIKSVAAKGFEVSKIISLIDNFSQTYKIQQTHEQKQLILKHQSNYEFLHLFQNNKLNELIIADLIINQNFNREILSNILLIIKKQQQMTENITTGMKREKQTIKSQFPYEMGVMIFLQNLCECMRLCDNATLQELLTNNYYSLKPRKLAIELRRERTFHLLYDKSSSEYSVVADLKSHSAYFQNLHPNNNYYARFCSYIINLSKLVSIPYKGYCISDLLKVDACDIIGELIFDYDMTPMEIESNVSALNLNLVHVIALNICPEIAGKTKNNLNLQNDHKEETIFNYITNQNVLLAYLLHGITNTSHMSLIGKLNSIYWNRYLELQEMQVLAKMYDDNIYVAALLSDQLNMKALAGVKSKFIQLKILLLKMGIQGPLTKRIAELEIDRIITELIAEDNRNIHLVEYMHDIAIKAKLIHEHFTRISTTRLAKELIESILEHQHAEKKIPQILRETLEHTLNDITIYAKVSEVLEFESWPQAYDFALKTPNTIFEMLLKLKLYKLCYDWCNVIKFLERFAQFKKKFMTTLLETFLSLNDDENDTNQPIKIDKYLLEIFETFPQSDCINFLDNHKDKFRCLDLMNYTIDYLIKNTNNTINYKNFQISLLIFKHLNQSERCHFWKIFKYPLLIIEKLIMNAKFEILTRILNVVRKELQNDSINILEQSLICAFCFNKHGNIYDIYSKTSNTTQRVHFQLGSTDDSSRNNNSAFILLNFNLYQKDHIVHNECIDLLLRIYATKALDYHISETASSSCRYSFDSNREASLDSLCGAFKMPKTAPIREEWIRDDEATHCMCCRRAVFTMLIRRHHCRRCGRVVCYACSTHRMCIPNLYNEVEVRVCNDCHHFIIAEQAREKNVFDDSSDRSDDINHCNSENNMNKINFKWKLSGNITHDKLLREEFCYEHAPSVGLCLTILSYHLDQQKYVDLLLYHCGKLEKLIVPNPEIDYELVAQMMNCLAIAAKVRGGMVDVETICEYSEIIMSVVQSGCESLIPPGPSNDDSLRKLADSLVLAEKWQLALDIHLKRGFPITGVMAAHGLACLRAGCFDTAREKFSLCMPKLSTELVNTLISKLLLSTTPNNSDYYENMKQHNIPHIKRSHRGGPALLQEIIKIIESLPIVQPQRETIERMTKMLASSTSLASLQQHRKEVFQIPIHEPAQNILTTLANLKHITKGNYNEGSLNATQFLDNQFVKRSIRQSRSFEECLHYILTYGSNADILKFFIRQQELAIALKYFLLQNLESELFIHNIYLISLRTGKVPALITLMRDFDTKLQIWRKPLLQTCRYLEQQKYYNSLYQLQLLLNDPIRASMTCVKFYTKDCENFQHLHANSKHLRNAHLHLQSELNIIQWENVNMNENVGKQKKNMMDNRSSSVNSVNCTYPSQFPMQMDAKRLNSHINTILRQLEVAKFLAKCEKENISLGATYAVANVLKQLRLMSGKSLLPTLFDDITEKIQICVLLLACGKNIEEGFSISYRILHDYKLPPLKVYGATAKYLARNNRLAEVEKLTNCITSSNGIFTHDIDDILSIAINSTINCHEPGVKSTLDYLAKKIHSIDLRISSHIFIGQLKTAYLLAHKHERLADIRRILRQAELTNQLHIKKLCEKKLNIKSTQLVQQL